jgi:hypothetical protein
MLRSQVLLDGLKGTGTVLAMYHWLLCGLLETGFMSLLIPVAKNQSQVDSVHNGLALNSLRVFPIMNTKFQVFNSTDLNMDAILT